MRKDPLINNEVYHVISRSIAKYEIFNDPQDFDRIIDLIDLFQYSDFTIKYSNFLRLSESNQLDFIGNIKKSSPKLVDIVGYCIMPTHIHLILKQLYDRGISKYTARFLNGYTRFFNIKHNRVGPLWDGRFKSILVDNNEQLLHLTRYIHLNPSSAGLVNNPTKWPYSSLNEYLGTDDKKICNFDTLIDLNAKKYKDFLLDRVNYQKELSKIKYKILENYSG